MTDDSLVIAGVLREGLRVAAEFTELPWVREQFQRKLGLDVWPGTMNLQVNDAADRAALARLRAGPDAPDAFPGVPIDPPGEGYCVGWCFPARIAHLSAAVVVPHVPDYPADKLELVAGVRVRDALNLEPGDRVVVTVEPARPNAMPASGDSAAGSPRGQRAGPRRAPRRE